MYTNFRAKYFRHFIKVTMSKCRQLSHKLISQNLLMWFATMRIWDKFFCIRYYMWKKIMEKRNGMYRFANQEDSVDICGWFWLYIKFLKNLSLRNPLSGNSLRVFLHFPIRFLMFYIVFPQFLLAFPIFLLVILPVSYFKYYERKLETRKWIKKILVCLLTLLRKLEWWF